MIAILTLNFTVYICVYQGCPQTLAEICRNIGICDESENTMFSCANISYLEGDVISSGKKRPQSSALLAIYEGSDGFLSQRTSDVDHYSDVIMRRLKSPTFPQPFVQAQIIENIKAPRHWPLLGNSPITGEFPAQRASNAENVSIWWRHHDSVSTSCVITCSHFTLLLIPGLIQYLVSFSSSLTGD